MTLLCLASSTTPRRRNLLVALAQYSVTHFRSSSTKPSSWFLSSLLSANELSVCHPLFVVIFHHGCLYVHTQLILKEFDFLAFSCLIIPVVASINALIFQSNKGNIIAFVDRCKNCHCNSSHCNPVFSNPRFWKLQIIRTGP